MFANIKDVTVIDPMTVEGRHEDAVGRRSRRTSTSYGRLGIMAETQLDDGKNCFKDMIGTGPFKFKGDWVSATTTSPS